MGTRCWPGLGPGSPGGQSGTRFRWGPLTAPCLPLLPHCPPNTELPPASEPLQLLPLFPTPSLWLFPPLPCPHHSSAASLTVKGAPGLHSRPACHLLPISGSLGSEGDSVSGSLQCPQPRALVTHHTNVCENILALPALPCPPPGRTLLLQVLTGLTCHPGPAGDSAAPLPPEGASAP